MSANDIFVGVVGAVMGLVVLTNVPRAWRGYWTRQQKRFGGRLRTHGELALIWWPFGDATRRGAIRGFVAVTLWWCGSTVFYWASFQGAGSASSSSRGWHVVAWIFAVWSLASLALALTVMFFNWPKFVVPPPYRGEPGAVAEWRSTRRASRKRARP